jgi:hypothetical protein
MDSLIDLIAAASLDTRRAQQIETGVASISWDICGTIASSMTGTVGVSMGNLLLTGHQSEVPYSCEILA